MQVKLVFVEDFVTGEWLNVAPAGPRGASIPNIKQPLPFVPAQKSALLRSFPVGPRKTLFGSELGNDPGPGRAGPS